MAISNLHHEKQHFNPDHYTEDGFFTREQILDYKDTFDAVDKDGNGHIDVNELTECLSLVGMKMSTIHLTELFEETDTNEDGFLDFGEFVHMLKLRSLVSSEEEDLRIAFNNFDKNHSRFIEADDIKALLISLGERISDEDAAEMIKMADLDGDGKVSFQDYSTFIKNS